MSETVIRVLPESRLRDDEFAMGPDTHGDMHVSTPGGFVVLRPWEWNSPRLRSILDERRQSLG